MPGIAFLINACLLWTRIVAHGIDQAAPRDASRTKTCYTTLLSPTPSGKVCAVQGTVGVSGGGEKAAIISIPRNDPSPLDTCLDRCFSFKSNSYPCLSFGFNTTNNICALYIIPLPFIYFEVGPGPGHFLYDRSCFGSNCVLPSPTYVQPSTSCTPYPTYAATCDQNGALATPNRILSFSDRGPSRIACPQTCKAMKACQSYSLAPKNHCHIFGSTLAQQGYYNDSARELFHYFDRSCIRFECFPCIPPSTPEPPPSTTASACTPPFTQLVRNPSFDQSASGSPWTFSGGARLVQDSPSDAYMGANFAELDLTQPRTSASVSQTIMNLQPNTSYTLRHYLADVRDGNCAGTCDYGIYVNNVAIFGSGAGGTRIIRESCNQEYLFPYMPELVTFSPNATTVRLDFNLTCNHKFSPLKKPVTLRIDSVNLIANTSCRLQLRLSSATTGYDGYYLSPAGILGLWPGLYMSIYPPALGYAFTLDGYHYLSNEYYGYVITTPVSPFLALDRLGKETGQFTEAYGGHPVSCLVTPESKLECSAFGEPLIFRYCNVCQASRDPDVPQDLWPLGLAAVPANDTTLFICAIVELNVLYV